MQRGKTLLVTVVAIALCVSVYGWLRLVHPPTQTACGYCTRPLHANLMVTAEIAGKRTQVCCARCAISEANQQHRPLRLIQVHDYLTGRAIAPETAWFVEGSRAMSCDHDATRMNEMKGTQELTYDRCSPGTVSFASKSDAIAFTATNGGAVLPFASLMREVRFQ